MPNEYASLVWSTTPEMTKQLKRVPLTTFVDLVNAALRLPYADLRHYLRELEGEGAEERLHEDYMWRDQLITSNRMKDPSEQDWVPPRVVDVDPDSRASFPLRMRHVERYASHRVALIGYQLFPLIIQGAG